METRISFAARPRDASDTLSPILGTLTQQLGTKVGLSNLPMLSFAKRSVTLGAGNEPANVVLVHLFEQLSMTGPSSYFSYHLLFDPGLNYYLLDISAVAAVRMKVQPAPTPLGGTTAGQFSGGAPIKK
jgi:hypothetical protein